MMITVGQVKEIFNSLVDDNKEIASFGVNTFANTHLVTIHFAGDENSSLFAAPVVTQEEVPSE